MFNPFKKAKDKETKQVKQELKTPERGEVDRGGFEERANMGSSVFLGAGGAASHKVLRGFYVSEKASMGMSDNQYMFKVFNNANKSEVKKEVSKLFKVEVKGVKILNMPEKRRDFGKHPGSRSGFKKAIVILKPGYTIGQAR